MIRLLGVFVLLLVMGCGGGGSSTGKHPDGAPKADGAGGADSASEAPPSGGDVAAEATSEGGGSDGAADQSADQSVDRAADETPDGGSDGDASGDGYGGGGDAAGGDAFDGAVVDVGDGGGDAADGEVAPPKLVIVAFTGKVATVANAPLGFDSTALNAPVSGSFTYDLRLLDDTPADPKRGKFQRFGTTAFTFTVKGHTVTGSGTAIVQTEDLDPDTFRFLDGPQGDLVVRTMKLDGTDAPTLKLFIAITDSTGAMLTSDALPDPFPTLDIKTKPHTFSLQDGGGTLLMQLDTLVNQ